MQRSRLHKKKKMTRTYCTVVSFFFFFIKRALKYLLNKKREHHHQWNGNNNNKVLTVIIASSISFSCKSVAVRCTTTVLIMNTASSVATRTTLLEYFKRCTLTKGYSGTHNHPCWLRDVKPNHGFTELTCYASCPTVTK